MRTKYFILIISLITLIGCKGDDFQEYFDKTPNQRITEHIQHYRQVLTQAQDGWKMAYYINKDYMGAFNLMMKFDEKNNVDMQFELSKNNRASTYDLRAEDEIALSFDTYTFLSAISDPGAYDDRKGLDGEFEFFIHSACKDSVVMIGKKNRRKAVLYPATKYDWENRFADIKNIQKQLKEQPQPKLNTNEYAIRKLLFNNLLSTNETVDFVYNSTNRTAKVAFKNSQGDIQVFDRSLEFNNTGFSFSAPITIKEQQIQHFQFNTDEQIFYSKENSCKIGFQKNAEALISKIHPMWEHHWHFTDDWECSPSIKPYIKEVIKVLDTDNPQIYLFLFNNALITWSFRYDSGGGDGWADYYLRQLYFDNLNSICFLQPLREDSRYNHNKPKSKELYQNPITRQFIDLLHQPEGWIVIELEYQKRYRLVSKTNKNDWFILEEGYNL